LSSSFALVIILLDISNFLLDRASVTYLQ